MSPFVFQYITFVAVLAFVVYLVVGPLQLRRKLATLIAEVPGLDRMSLPRSVWKAYWASVSEFGLATISLCLWSAAPRHDSNSDAFPLLIICAVLYVWGIGDVRRTQRMARSTNS